MPHTLDKVRQALAKASGANGGAPRNPSYPYYMIPIGSTAVLRLLPDADPDADLPYVTKYTVKLPFNGISGGEHATDAPVICTVVSEETWGQKGVITGAISHLWNGSDEEKALARAYYRRANYIWQCLVVANPVNEPATVPPIRTLNVGKAIHELLTSALTDTEAVYAPYDVTHGRDWRCVPVMQGNYRNYSKSSYSLRERPLSDQEQATIEQHGLRRLADELGTPPSDEAKALLLPLLNDSLNGKAFDAERFGKHYRAFPARNGDGNATGATSAAPNAENVATSEALLAALKRRNTATTSAA